MKKIILLLICFLFSFVCFSQTLLETEDWLSFNLKKYFQTDYNYNSLKNSIRTLKFYPYRNRDFKFVNDRLIIETFHIIMDSTEKPKLNEDIVDTINLKKIIKIEYDGFGTTYKPFFIDFNFIFKNMNGFNDDNPVKRFSRKPLVKQLEGAYQMNYSFRSEDIDILKDDMPARIVKAFEYLVKLSGGKIVKDVF